MMPVSLPTSGPGRQKSLRSCGGRCSGHGYRSNKRASNRLPPMVQDQKRTERSVWWELRRGMLTCLLRSASVARRPLSRQCRRPAWSAMPRKPTSWLNHCLPNDEISVSVAQHPRADTRLTGWGKDVSTSSPSHDILSYRGSGPNGHSSSATYS